MSWVLNNNKVFHGPSISEAEFIKVIGMSEHYAVIDRLKANIKELTEVAEIWMNDYDKLKAKYEPSVLVESTSDVEASSKGES